MITEPSQTLTLNTTIKIASDVSSLETLDWIVLQNASPFLLQMVSGSYIFQIPAWYYYPIPLVDGRGFPLRGFASPITATPILQTIQGSGLTSTLFPSLYGHGETPHVTIPQTLGGSPINVPGIANQLINHSDASGTLEIRLSPTGDAQDAFAVTNNGVVAIGDAANAGSLSVVGPITATGAIQGDTTNNLVFDSRGHAGVFRVSGVQEFFWDSNGVTFNNDLHFPTGVGVAAANNLVLKNGTLDLSGLTGGNAIKFPAGTLTRVTFGFTAVVTTGTAITHGLGATPQAVLSQPSANFTCFIDTVGATTFTAHPSVNGNIWWLALFG